MSFSLHIKADDSKAVNVVVTQAGEHIVATRGSSDHLIADNKTEHQSVVHIKLDGTPLGSWRLKPHHKLKIDEEISEEHDHKSTFVFGVTSNTKNITCESHSVEAEFRWTVQGQVRSSYTLIPIQVCGHIVNR